MVKRCDTEYQRVTVIRRQTDRQTDRNQYRASALTDVRARVMEKRDVEEFIRAELIRFQRDKSQNAQNMMKCEEEAFS